MHLVVEGNRDEIFRVLIEHDNLRLELQDKSGFPPLWHALASSTDFSDSSYASMLIKKGASPDAVSFSTSLTLPYLPFPPSPSLFLPYSLLPSLYPPYPPLSSLTSPPLLSLTLSFYLTSPPLPSLTLSPSPSLYLPYSPSPLSLTLSYHPFPSLTSWHSLK